MKKTQPKGNQKLVNNTTTSKRSQIEERARARRTKKLVALGVSQSKIDSIIQQEDVRMVYLLVYSDYNKTKLDKTIKDNKLNLTGTDKICYAFKTDKDNVNTVVEKLAEFGRTSVFKPKKFTIPEIVQVVPNVHVKKPTSNTKEVKLAAKKARKAANIAAFKARKKRVKAPNLKFKAPGKKAAQNANKVHLKVCRKQVKKAA